MDEIVKAESAEARLREYVSKLRELDALHAELDRQRRQLYLAAKADGFATRAVKAAAKSTDIREYSIPNVCAACMANRRRFPPGPGIAFERDPRPTRSAFPWFESYQAASASL